MSVGTFRAYMVETSRAYIDSTFAIRRMFPGAEKHRSHQSNLVLVGCKCNLDMFSPHTPGLPIDTLLLVLLKSKTPGSHPLIKDCKSQETRLPSMETSYSPKSPQRKGKLVHYPPSAVPSSTPLTWQY